MSDQNFRINRIPLDKNGNPISESGIEVKKPGGIQKTDDNYKVSRLPEGYGEVCYKVKRIPLPIAEFTPDVTAGCAPLSVSFSGSDSLYADSYLYSFGTSGMTSGDQSPSVEFTAGGLYDVSMTASSALALASDTKTDYDLIWVLTQPVADFHASATSGDSPLEPQFFSDVTGDVSSWIWNLGNGSTSGDENPIAYYTAGTYAVSLTAGNGYCSDSIEKADYIVVSEGGGGSWVQKFDNTFWFGDNSTECAWTGTEWENRAGEYGGMITVLGTWATGYRPTKIRITTSRSCTIFIRDETWNDLIGSCNPTANTPIEADLSYTNNVDIFRLLFIAYSTNDHITNIEFWEEA